LHTKLAINRFHHNAQRDFTRSEINAAMTNHKAHRFVFDHEGSLLFVASQAMSQCKSCVDTESLELHANAHIGNRMVARSPRSRRIQRIVANPLAILAQMGNRLSNPGIEGHLRAIKRDALSITVNTKVLRSSATLWKHFHKHRLPNRCATIRTLEMLAIVSDPKISGP
jgi:hypothetical protein